LGWLLWAIQAWYAEMENEERSENVRLGHARAGFERPGTMTRVCTIFKIAC
jgi:hypothetical protein